MAIIGGVILLVIIAIIFWVVSSKKGKTQESISQKETSKAEVKEVPLEEEITAPAPQKEEVSIVEEEKVEEVSPEAELLVIKEPIEELPNISREDFKNYANKTVLVVEDNKINQKLILTLMSNSGINLEVADNGQEALEKLHQLNGECDLVLMDVNMPVMDGLQATREIRKDPLLKNIPVVALTASTDPHEVEAILDAGMNAYLDKPINLGKLYNIFTIFIKN